MAENNNTVSRFSDEEVSSMQNFLSGKRNSMNNFDYVRYLMDNGFTVPAADRKAAFLKSFIARYGYERATDYLVANGVPSDFEVPELEDPDTEEDSES